MIIDVFRFILGSIFLFYASLLDIKTRRVPNRVWIVMGALALLLLIIQLGIEGAWYHYLIIPSLLTLYSFPFVELDKKPDLRNGIITPFIWYSMILSGIITTIFLIYYGGTGYLTLSLIACSVFIILIYLMYFSRLLFGGADAKGMMAITLLVPFYPEIWNIPLFSPKFRALMILFPFPAVILSNSVVVFSFLPVVLLLYNLAHGDVGKPMFLGYKIKIDAIPGKHLWLMERPQKDDEELRIKIELFPEKYASERLEDELKILRQMGKERVWVTPKIPFMVGMFGGYVLSFVVGNVLFYLMDLILG